MKTSLLAGVIAGGAAMGLFWERDAAACGGCIQPVKKVVSTITAERMIFSISSTQSTLYDEITFSGSPESFAWVLPIKGTVTVGLSADLLFATIDQLTATYVDPPTRTCGGFGGGSGGSGGSKGGGGGGSKGSSGGGVTVITQQQVGPYETVQLASKDGSALTNWLTTNGYAIAAADAPTIAAYVAAGLNFLAMKLVPGVGVSAMQPVRVTTAGAFPVLPLRMVGVGTGATTGITLWVVADGRWEPQNFPFFTIEDSDLTWDWYTLSSNYEVVRLAKEAALGGGGFQVESSLDLSEVTIQSELLTNVEFEGDGGGGYLPPPDGGPDGSSGGTSDSGSYYTGPMATAASADLAVLFAGIKGPNARITRLRSDLAHSAMSNDLVLQASADQSEVSNQLTPLKQAGPGCAYYPDGGSIDTGTDAGTDASPDGGDDTGSGGTSGAGGTGAAGSGGGHGNAGSMGHPGGGGRGGSAGTGAPADDAGDLDTAGEAGGAGGCNGCSTTASAPPLFDIGGGAILAIAGLRAAGARARRRRGDRR
jgi:hypothetical protein